MEALKLTPRQAKEWGRLHPMLLEVAGELMDLWPSADMVVTSIHRTLEENASAGAKTTVHCTSPHRAMDIRIKNSMQQDKADDIADWLNSVFSYDPDRPELKVCISKPHGTGPHIHLQVHPKSQRVAHQGSDEYV